MKLACEDWASHSRAFAIPRLCLPVYPPVARTSEYLQIAGTTGETDAWFSGWARICRQMNSPAAIHLIASRESAHWRLP